MKIGLRYGHSINCKGASKIIDEVNSCKELYYLVKDLLQSKGHTIIDCNSNASTESGELNEGTNKADNNNVDIYITLHMNAYNGVAKGVECWTYNSDNSLAIGIGNKICKNISSLGTQNRGMKYDTGKHDLNSCRMQSIIVESLFCDNQDDVNIFRDKKEQIARAIANAIDSNINLNNSTEIDEMSYEGKQEVDNKITVYSHSTDPNVLYKYYYELNGKWTTVTDWQELNRCSFMPRQKGAYKVVCHVKFKNNKTETEDAYNFVTINIKDKPSIYNMKVNGAYYGETYYEDIAAAVEKEMTNGVKEITLIKK